MILLGWMGWWDCRTQTVVTASSPRRPCITTASPLHHHRVTVFLSFLSFLTVTPHEAGPWQRRTQQDWRHNGGQLQVHKLFNFKGLQRCQRVLAWGELVMWQASGGPGAPDAFSRCRF
jgi:hypothetical protein